MPGQYQLGYPAIVIYGGTTPAFSPNTSLQERENWINNNGGYSVDPRKATGRIPVPDCTELSGKIDLEATPAILNNLSSWVNIRATSQIGPLTLVNQNAYGSPWDVIYALTDGWQITKALPKTVTLSTNSGGLLMVSTDIVSYGRGINYKQNLAYVADPQTGINNGTWAAQVTQLQNQRIPYWQTQWESGDWSGLDQTCIGWSIQFDNNLKEIYACEGLGIQPPLVTPQGELSVTVQFTVLLDLGIEPPLSMNGAQLNILGQPITFTLLNRYDRAVPIGKSNDAILWQATYMMQGTQPDFSLFAGFGTPSAGIT